MIDRLLRGRIIRKVTKVAMALMWLLSFFSINRYDLGLISFKQALNSIILYTAYFIINAVILACNKKTVRERCNSGNF